MRKNLTCNWRANSEWNGTKTEQESYSLRGPSRSHNVEGNWTQQRNEAAIEEAHDERKND